MRNSIRVAGLALGLACAVFSGCGRGPKTVPVTGKVTFGGKIHPDGGTLAFTPLSAAEGYPMKTAIGSFDEFGVVLATTYKLNDGLVPGRYEIKVECWRKFPSETSPGESYIPAHYKAPPLEVPARSKEPVQLILDLPAVEMPVP